MSGIEAELEVDEVQRALNCIKTLTDLGIRSSTGLSDDLDRLRGVNRKRSEEQFELPKCPNGHKLINRGCWMAFSQQGGWCDKCGITKGTIKLMRWRCESKPQQCNYDICSNCYLLKSTPSVMSLHKSDIKETLFTSMLSRGMEQQRESATQAMLKLISLGIPHYNNSVSLRLQVLVSRNSSKKVSEFATDFSIDREVGNLQNDITMILDRLDHSRTFSKKIIAFRTGSVNRHQKKTRIREKSLRDLMQAGRPSKTLEHLANEIIKPARSRRTRLKIKNDFSTASDTSMGMFDVPGSLSPVLATSNKLSSSSMLDWLSDSAGNLFRVVASSDLKCNDDEHSKSGSCCATAAAVFGISTLRSELKMRRNESSANQVRSRYSLWTHSLLSCLKKQGQEQHITDVIIAMTIYVTVLPIRTLAVQAMRKSENFTTLMPLLFWIEKYVKWQLQYEEANSSKRQLYRASFIKKTSILATNLLLKWNEVAIVSAVPSVVFLRSTPMTLFVLNNCHEVDLGPLNNLGGTCACLAPRQLLSVVSVVSPALLRLICCEHDIAVVTGESAVNGSIQLNSSIALNQQSESPREKSHTSEEVDRILESHNHLGYLCYYHEGFINFIQTENGTTIQLTSFITKFMFTGQGKTVAAIMLPPGEGQTMSLGAAAAVVLEHKLNSFIVVAIDLLKSEIASNLKENPAVVEEKVLSQLGCTTLMTAAEIRTRRVCIIIDNFEKGYLLKGDVATSKGAAKGFLELAGLGRSRWVNAKVILCCSIRTLNCADLSLGKVLFGSVECDINNRKLPMRSTASPRYRIAKSNVDRQKPCRLLIFKPNYKATISQSDLIRDFLKSKASREVNFGSQRIRFYSNQGIPFTTTRNIFLKHYSNLFSPEALRTFFRFATLNLFAATQCLIATFDSILDKGILRRSWDILYINSRKVKWSDQTLQSVTEGWWKRILENGIVAEWERTMGSYHSEYVASSAAELEIICGGLPCYKQVVKSIGLSQPVKSFKPIWEIHEAYLRCEVCRYLDRCHVDKNLSDKDSPLDLMTAVSSISYAALKLFAQSPKVRSKSLSHTSVFILKSIRKLCPNYWRAFPIQGLRHDDPDDTEVRIKHSSLLHFMMARVIWQVAEVTTDQLDDVSGAENIQIIRESGFGVDVDNGVNRFLTDRLLRTTTDLPKEIDVLLNLLIATQSGVSNAQIFNKDHHIITADTINTLSKLLSGKYSSEVGVCSLLLGGYLKNVQLPQVVFDNLLLTAADLTGSDFTGATFTKTVLSKGVLNRTVISGCDFSYATLDYTTYYHADARGTSFVNASITNSRFDHAILRSSLFQNSNLSSSCFRNSKLEGSVFNSATMCCSTLDFALLNETDFRKVDLSKSSLQSTKLRKARLVKANLSDTNFKNADLYSADLTDATLDGADLESADLDGAILAGATFVGALLSTSKNLIRSKHLGAVFAGAILTKINLKNQDLRGLNFSKVKLQEANLSGCNICNAILRDADLSGANLSGAVFNGADCCGCQFSGADLNRTRFIGTNLLRSSFKKCSLEGTVFRDSRLEAADFSHCRAVKCDFRNANISRALVNHAAFVSCEMDDTKFDFVTAIGVRFVLSSLKAARFVEAAMSSANFIESNLTSAMFLAVGDISTVGLTDCVMSSCVGIDLAKITSTGGARLQKKEVL